MEHIIKKTPFRWGMLFLLIMAPFICHKSYATTVRCGPDSNTSNSITAFDFNQLPNQIPNTVPVGTTIYDVTMDLELWCAKEINASTVTSGYEKIYINRDNINNILGNNSGLTFYVTINGDRGTAAKSYDSGYTTNAVFATGLSTSYYTKITIPVRVELVKTAQNVSMSPMKNDVWLFSVGDAGTGYMRYRATNVKKLSFSEFTCNATTPDIYQTLPVLNISEIQTSGSVDGHTIDFPLSLRCNGNLWSTLSINMAFSGTPVTGLERNGVYQFLNDSGTVAQGIGFQILHQNSAGDFIETANGEWFKIGDFISRNEIITVPLRAAYYRTSGNLTPGALKGTVTYTIDYM